MATKSILILILLVLLVHSNGTGTRYSQKGSDVGGLSKGSNVGSYRESGSDYGKGSDSRPKDDSRNDDSKGGKSKDDDSKTGSDGKSGGRKKRRKKPKPTTPDTTEEADTTEEPDTTQAPDTTQEPPQTTGATLPGPIPMPGTTPAQIPPPPPGCPCPCIFGEIKMWFTDDIPVEQGYQMCDGTNGSPDMTDKFPVAAGGDFNKGDCGGRTEVTLIPENIPSHSHDIFDGDLMVTMDGGHQHDAAGYVGFDGGHNHSAGKIRNCYIIILFYFCTALHIW